MIRSTDVAIVGAGPAGAWAAYCLARRGVHATIFDASHPREKPCGGGVTGRALALVAGAIGESSLPSTPVVRARFVQASTGQAATLALDGRCAPDRDLVVASRTVFDAVLLRAAASAGAKVAAARVVDVSVDDGGARIDTTAGAVVSRFLIGADGANSLVRRRLARPFRRCDLSVATGYFAHGVTSEEIVLELIDSPPGYIWSFPRPTHLAIGICAQADARVTTAALRARTAAWIHQSRIAEGARLEPYSWPIPSLSVPGLARLSLAGARWCLVGDAAGLVDPITREGIYFALLSGQWAAEAACGGSGHQYAERVRAQLLPELARAATLKAGFFCLASGDLLIQALRRSPAVGAVMADLIAGRQGYTDLRWRLLRTLEWSLAWEAACHDLRCRLSGKRGQSIVLQALRLFR